MRTKVDKQTVKFKVSRIKDGTERQMTIELPRTRDIVDLKKHLFFIETMPNIGKVYKKGNFLIVQYVDSFFKELFDINGRQYENIYPNEELVFVTPQKIEIYEKGLYNKTIDMIPGEPPKIISKEEFDFIMASGFGENESC